MKNKWLPILAFLAMGAAVFADESILAFTYTTDLLPKGHWEAEQWVTGRSAEEAGTYGVVDFREELEYGVADNFQRVLPEPSLRRRA